MKETDPVALPVGYTLVAFDTIGSTNDEAKERATAGAPSGTVVWTREQTAGRGRRGRAWVSPPGNLYCSTLLRPLLDQSARLSFAAALAIADTVRTFLPPDTPVNLKWPNDVLVHGAKISGLLLEADLTAPWIVIGIGINLAFHPPEMPYPCTDLGVHRRTAGMTDPVTPDQALPVLVQVLDRWVHIWEKQGFSAIRDAWLKQARGVGQPVTARLPDREIAGVFEALDDSGALVLRLPDGTRQTITAADVFFPEKESVSP
ncbi:MAG: biotin--[acetyl-CoA-carboxylase] ligase [Pseudomonadota bacterium]|nr:biotin--[acetyl-CoA-carboxylase] ligase [Pseudomonadota bacterium]